MLPMGMGFGVKQTLRIRAHPTAYTASPSAATLCTACSPESMAAGWSVLPTQAAQDSLKAPPVSIWPPLALRMAFTDLLQVPPVRAAFSKIPEAASPYPLELTR